MATVPRLTGDDVQFVLVVLVLIGGVVVGYTLGWLVRRTLIRLGVPQAVEGTSAERTARRFGTSVVALFGHLTAWFVYGVAVILALRLAQLLDATLFWNRITGFIPDLFIALLVLAAGFVVGDKAELIVSERLRGVKLPEIGFLPKLVKYSVVYVAVLVGLNQVGVAAGALLILLGGYVGGLIVLSAVALKDVLAAGAAGVFLLLHQPFGIGDRVTIDGREGVVQEVGVLVTRIESEEAEYVVPNHLVFRRGVAVRRD